MSKSGGGPSPPRPFSSFYWSKNTLVGTYLGVYHISVKKIIESRYIGISDIIGKSSILKNSNYRKIIESQYIDIFRNSDKIIDINNFDIGNLRELSANLLILKITEELSKIYLSYTPHIHF